jgi:hypothetical protein
MTKFTEDLFIAVRRRATGRLARALNVKPKNLA